MILILEELNPAFKKDLVKTNLKLKAAKRIIEASGISYDEIKSKAKYYASKYFKGDKDALNEMIAEFKSNKFKSISYGVLGVLIASAVSLYLTVVFTNIMMFYGAPAILTKYVPYIVIGPITEELFKYYSVKKNLTLGGFVGFNIMEVLVYTMKIVSSGYSIPIAVLLRLPAVIMHWKTTKKQFYARREGKPLRGLAIATMIHSLFNVAGAIFSEKAMPVLSSVMVTDSGVEEAVAEFLEKFPGHSDTVTKMLEAGKKKELMSYINQMTALSNKLDGIQ